VTENTQVVTEIIIIGLCVLCEVRALRFWFPWQPVLPGCVRYV